MRSTSGQPRWACPACGEPLAMKAREALACAGCDRVYPVICGIPDLRLRSGPYLDLEADRAKARRLAEAYDDCDLHGLLERYWSLTPDTPPSLARGFVRQALQSMERGHDLLDQLAALDPLPEPGAAAGRRLLEIGCRSGGLVAAARLRGFDAVGIDVALRWLVIARKQLTEAGLDVSEGVPLAAADAGRLPFADQTFDFVLAEHVLEHTSSPEELLAEAHRTLASRGVLLATTWNRWTPAPEPHVGLVGVGWLPRSWARKYVRLRRGDPYLHVHLRSPLECRHLGSSSPFSAVRLSPSPLGARWTRRLGGGPLLRRLLKLYDRLCDRPPWRWPAVLVGPVLRMVAWR